MGSVGIVWGVWSRVVGLRLKGGREGSAQQRWRCAGGKVHSATRVMRRMCALACEVEESECGGGM